MRLTQSLNRLRREEELKGALLWRRSAFPYSDRCDAMYERQVPLKVFALKPVIRSAPVLSRDVIGRTKEAGEELAAQLAVGNEGET